VVVQQQVGDVPLEAPVIRPTFPSRARWLELLPKFVEAVRVCSGLDMLNDTKIFIRGCSVVKDQNRASFSRLECGRWGWCRALKYNAGGLRSPRTEYGRGFMASATGHPRDIYEAALVFLEEQVVDIRAREWEMAAI
jgi:hypothetical protein